MSFLSFLTPLYYGYQAYASTSITNSLEEVYDSGTIVRHRKGTPSYDEKIKEFLGHNRVELGPFLQKLGVRKDLIVTPSPNGLCAAKGTNFFSNGVAAISYSPDFEKTDYDACSFLIKHQTSHIINNDCFTMNFVPAVCTLAVAIFATFTMSMFCAALTVSAIGLVASAAFSQYRMRKADDLAIAESTDEELKGGRRLLLSLQELNAEELEKFWLRFIISPSGKDRLAILPSSLKRCIENVAFSGENMLDIWHPSLKSRIKKVEDELMRRGVERYALENVFEREDIISLKGFISEVQSK